MYGRILVPLDGSRRAEAILPHVEEIALNCKSEVIFLQVIEPPPLLTDSEIPLIREMQQQVQDAAREADLYLAGLCGEFQEKGMRAKRRVTHGNVISEVLNAAERERADLIAIASHGRSGLARVFYGSVAAGILQRADRPLLIIRAD